MFAVAAAPFKRETTQKRAEIFEMRYGDTKTFLIINLGVFVFFCLSYWLVSDVIGAAQDMLIPGASSYVSLLFLPTGVRIVALILFDWRAIPPLLAGAVICNYHFWGLTEFEPLFMLSAASTLVFYLALKVSQKLGQSVFLEDTLPRLPATETVILVTFLGSALNGVVSAALLGNSAAYLNGGLIAMGYILGDVLGTLCFLLLVKKLFSFMNKQQINL